MENNAPNFIWYIALVVLALLILGLVMYYMASWMAERKLRLSGVKRVDGENPSTKMRAIAFNSYLGTKPSNMEKANIHEGINITKFLDKILITFNRNQVEFLVTDTNVKFANNRDIIKQSTYMLIKITMNNMSILMEIRRYYPEGTLNEENAGHVTLYFTKETKFKYQDVLDIAKDCIFVTKPSSMTSEINSIVWNEQGRMYEAKPFNIKNILTSDIMDMSYNVEPIKFQGKIHKFKVSEEIRIMRDIVKNGGNIMIKGPQGSGKTILGEYLLGDLAKLPFVNKVFYLSPENLADMFSSTFLHDVQGIFKTEEGKTNVLYIDEAQKVLNPDSPMYSAILPMLDGTVRRMFNGLSIVVSVNTSEASLGDAAIRAGRFDHTTTVLPLSADVAKELARHIVQSLPQNKIYDFANLDETIAQQNKKSDGTLIADKDEVVIAEVYSNVKPLILYQLEMGEPEKDFFTIEEYSAEEEPLEMVDDSTT